VRRPTERLLTDPSPGKDHAPAGGCGWRVHAVIPCFNRPADVKLLLGDLAGGEAAGYELSVVVVDNASQPRLEVGAAEGLSVEVLRLERNEGGSGGFRAGMSRALAGDVKEGVREAVWLLDSDVRLERGALKALLRALDRDQGLVAVGSALADPESGEVFEVGGRVSRTSGELEQPLPEGWEGRDVVEVEYAAACSLLVRREAVERAGEMGDFFLNGDDVEWCCRLRRRTGMKVGVATASRARHPRPDRMRTGARYYAARNCFAAMSAAMGGRAPRWLVFKRALREVGRALTMTMMGRDDLASLHVRGLRDAVRGVRGPAPEGTVNFEAFAPLAHLPGRLRQVLSERVRGKVMLRAGALADEREVRKALHAACVDPVSPERRVVAIRGAEAALVALKRLVRGPEFGVAVVAARGYPEDWLCARVMVTVAPEGFVVRRWSRAERAGRLIGAAARGVWWAARAAMSDVGCGREDRRYEIRDSRVAPRALSVSVVILSYNRKAALEKTLAELGCVSGPSALTAQSSGQWHEVIVADNGSTDGTQEFVRRKFRDVRLIDMEANLGVAAFNRAVARVSGDVVLILDDDAWPAEGALEKALAALAERPDVAAVALHPRHPGTGESEWRWMSDVGCGMSDVEPEGSVSGVTSAIRHPTSDMFPVMGCGNLVRREAWERVGGYEESFFLYRNDVDLALKLLSAGEGVWFDPEWVVWHDSPAAARKSLRWFEVATRNWIWVCRRHGRGWWRLAGIVSGWAWAHKLARWDVRAHWSAFWGAVDGLRKKPADVPACCFRDGAAFERLMRMRLKRGTKAQGIRASG
jgi:GT2 family glycosyltransferase